MYVHCILYPSIVNELLQVCLLLLSADEDDDDDKAGVIRGLDFGDAMDEVDQEVTDIAQRIQSLIDTSFEEDDDVMNATPKASPRKKRMRTKEQSFEDVEVWYFSDSLLSPHFTIIYFESAIFHELSLVILR